ncbi:MAG TPA: hypothetical protein DF610_17440, partial [Sphingobacterium sp.]|nr:hypothetical protein [Sphingobacterium sp.]
QLIDFVYGDYHLSDGQLYQLDAHMNEEPIVDESSRELLSKRFNTFKNNNKRFYTSKQLFPDSIYTNYFKQAISKP